MRRDKILLPLKNRKFYERLNVKGYADIKIDDDDDDDDEE